MKVNSIYTAANHRNIKQGVGYSGYLRAIKACRVALQVVILAALALIALSGCASKTQIKEVLVPQKCEVSPKFRPAKSGEAVKDLQNALVYTELLEADLRVCRGER